MEPVVRDKAAVSKCRKIRPEGLKLAFEVAEKIKMLPKKQAIKQKKSHFSQNKEKGLMCWPLMIKLIRKQNIYASDSRSLTFSQHSYIFFKNCDG
jgi:hypothetical protein